MCKCSCQFFVFFFFKQKTAYEMRISDWSSDVCSSDLRGIEMVECAVVPDHRRLVRMGFVDAARRAAIDHRLGYLLEMKGVAADCKQDARAAPRRVAVIIHHPPAVVAHDTGVGHEPRAVRAGRAGLKDRITGVATPLLQTARGR